MSKRLTTSILFAAALAASGGALAQQGPGPMTPEQRAARFDAADADKDGSLDKTEWLASIPAMMRERVTDDQLEQMWSNRLDADGDGKVTREQYMAMPARRPGGQ